MRWKTHFPTEVPSQQTLFTGEGVTVCLKEVFTRCSVWNKFRKAAKRSFHIEKLKWEPLSFINHYRDFLQHGDICLPGIFRECLRPQLYGWYFVIHCRRLGKTALTRNKIRSHAIKLLGVALRNTSTSVKTMQHKRKKNIKTSGTACH